MKPRIGFQISVSRHGVSSRRVPIAGLDFLRSLKGIGESLIRTLRYKIPRKLTMTRYVQQASPKYIFTFLGAWEFLDGVS